LQLSTLFQQPFLMQSKVGT